MCVYVNDSMSPRCAHICSHLPAHLPAHPQWAPARLALRALPHLKLGQLVSAYPGLMVGAGRLDLMTLLMTLLMMTLLLRRLLLLLLEHAATDGTGCLPLQPAACC